LEQVISRVLSLLNCSSCRRVMAIPLGLLLPTGSSNLPESSDGPPSNALLFGLAPDGACLAPDVTTETGELLPHRFTLTRHSRKPLPRCCTATILRQSRVPGGLLSVALSCSSPRLEVIQHPALWSPDFPPIPIWEPATI
jgi:hypothetical protein